MIEGRIVALCPACAGERELGGAEATRLARCACGATVELFRATTVVAPGGVQLACPACTRGERPAVATEPAPPRAATRRRPGRRLVWGGPAAAAAAAVVLLWAPWSGNGTSSNGAAVSAAVPAPARAARARPTPTARPAAHPRPHDLDRPARPNAHRPASMSATRHAAPVELARDRSTAPRGGDHAGARGPSAADDGVTAEVIPDDDAGGTHVVLRTSHGTVHVWAPPGYRASHASIVTYVHGYLTDVNEAWHEHHLAQQFLASDRNALFIVPSAPRGRDSDVRWRSLEALHAEVRSHVNLAWPSGSSVVIGHSGAFRSIARWLGSGHIDHIILLDALYGRRDRFDAWLNADPGHRLTIIAGTDTAESADELARRHPDAVVRTVTRHDLSELTDEERVARFLYLRTRDDSHMWLVTGAEAIPELLCSTRIEPVPPRILGP